MKIVVAGGAGFIGGHIAEYWNEEGADVHVIDSLRTGNIKNIDGLENVKLHKGSITDRELVFEVLKDAVYIYNLATSKLSVQSYITSY